MMHPWVTWLDNPDLVRTLVAFLAGVVTVAMLSAWQSLRQLRREFRHDLLNRTTPVL